DQAMSYGGGSAARHPIKQKPVGTDRRAVPSARPAVAPYQEVLPPAHHSCGCPTQTCECPDKKKQPSSPLISWPASADGSPDFAKMTSPQRRAYHRARLAKKFR